MAAEGVELLADLDRLAVLGFSEVVRHLPDLLRLRREVRKFLVDRGIDLLVPIDYPGFNLPLARYARVREVPVLYYIAPQVWAWHESRARKLAEDADLVCVVLPFEAELLERWGVRTRFVGHPLLDRTPAGSARPGTSRKALGLFPGSRLQEIERLLPVFLAAGEAVRKHHPELELLVAKSSDLPVEAYTEIWEAELVDTETALRDSVAAITKSGTITLQLALAGIPMVVGYRVSPITYAIARRLVSVDHIALVNLVAGRRVVPELIQHDASPARLAKEAAPLTVDTKARSAQQVALRQVSASLGEPGAAGRVADECLRLLAGAA